MSGNADENSRGREASGRNAADDAALMERVQRGEERALGELMERWELPVTRLLARVVLNAREAEDLAQETFVRVWQQRGKFRPGAAFRPWLFSIAMNLARNRLRWWRTRPSIALQDWDETDGTRCPDSGATPATEIVERAERANAVRDAVAALPVDLREALVLAEYEEFSHAEIAETLGCTTKAVESRVARAREKLRAALKAWV